MFLGSKLPPTLQIPPKNGQFSQMLSPISQPVGGIFQKSYILFEFCVLWAWGAWGKIAPPLENRGVSPLGLKNHFKLGKNGRFCLFFCMPILDGM